MALAKFGVFLTQFIFDQILLFKQKSVSVDKLSDDSCPVEFDVLKTNICLRSEAAGAKIYDLLVLITSNFQGATTCVRPIVLRHKHS